MGLGLNYLFDSSGKKFEISPNVGPHSSMKMNGMSWPDWEKQKHNVPLYSDML